MGFGLIIEADGETLQNKHPDDALRGSSGKAVFNFLSSLSYYDTCKNDNLMLDNELMDTHTWFEIFEEKATSISECRALIDCLWGDGGDFTRYSESDYDLFIQRHGAIRSDGVENTRESFLEFIQKSQQAFQPIEDIITGLRFLLNNFKHHSFEPIYFYQPEEPSYIEDFEVLILNLEFLEKRGNKRVRLTFS